MTDESINAASYAAALRPSTGREPLTVTVLGMGRAGSAVLAECLAAPDVRVVGAWNRTERAMPPGLPREAWACGSALPPPGLLNADLVLLAVRDDALPVLAPLLGLPPSSALLHLSGAADTGVLADATTSSIGSWHPLQAFTGAAHVSATPPYAVALQGETEAVARGRALAAALGHPAVELPPGGRAAYHAAAVLASNCLVALEATAVRAMALAGIGAADAWTLLWPLVAGTVENLRAGPEPGALTGPIARGDASTVKCNLDALAPDAAAVRVYRALSAEALSLAAEAGLPRPTLDTLAGILACQESDGA